MAEPTVTQNCSAVPLCEGFNSLILSIAKDLMPEGWDAIKDAPDTLPDALSYYHDEGRVAVNVDSAHGCTVGDPEAHYAFRAWHDLIHLEAPEMGTFDLKGEQWCADRHREEIVKRLGYTPEAAWYGALIQIEIVEQNRYFLRTGNWPADPRAFAVRWLKDRGWVRPDSLGGPISETCTVPAQALTA